MQIIVDEDSCVGHGECEAMAPEVFRVGDDGIAQILDHDASPEIRALVERAALYCPADAIKVIQ